MLGENPIELTRLELGEAHGYIVTSTSYELSIRCNESGRCEVMLRYEDQPAVTCTTRCYEDPASQLDPRLLRQLREKVENLVTLLGLKLLSLDDIQ